MNYRPIIKVIGIFLIILGMFMFIPAGVDIISGTKDIKVFVLSGLITILIGIVLNLSVWGRSDILGTKEAFILTTLSWFVIAVFSAIPFYLSDIGLDFTDSFFESMSGITTTGATVIDTLDDQSRGILIWRSLLQWLGGIGIIVMAVAVLPMLQIGGMQLFKLESSDASDKILPRAIQIAGSLTLLYLSLTLLCTLAYKFSGMGLFDSLAHSMTTISTGGYSTHNESFKYFDNVIIDYMAIIFMILGSLPFVLYLHLIRGKASTFYKDTQVISFIVTLLIIVFVTCLYLYFNNFGNNSEILRVVSFNIVSIMTGTGFVTDNYMEWGSFAVIIFFFIMFIGGCAGSTSCGIKIFRFQVLFQHIKIQLKKISYPNAIVIPRYNRKEIPDGASRSVMAFFLLFFLSFVLLSSVLSFMGLDTITALSAAASALANVGPGLGDTVGPSGSYSSMSMGVKWVLLLGMLLGRLELFTVLVILTPYFWRK
jgi:trk system potassium uptake protein